MAVQELEVALSTARLNHATAHDQLDQLTEQIAPAAERALAQAQEAYRAGRLMFLELVDAQRTFNDVRLRTMELRRDLALAEADLMSLLGAGPYADKGEVTMNAMTKTLPDRPGRSWRLVAAGCGDGTVPVDEHAGHDHGPRRADGHPPRTAKATGAPNTTSPNRPVPSAIPASSRRWVGAPDTMWPRPCAGSAIPP